MNRITELSKKRKITVLLCMLVAVCGLSVGALYVTGVLPAQTEGFLETPPISCTDKDCSCHISCWCRRCDQCYNDIHK